MVGLHAHQAARAILTLHCDGLLNKVFALDT